MVAGQVDQVQQIILPADRVDRAVEQRLQVVRSEVRATQAEVVVGVDGDRPRHYSLRQGVDDQVLRFVAELLAMTYLL